MKTLILSTVAALSIGAATIPASAQSITFGGGADRGGDCRTVEKRKMRNGKTVITRERQCNDRSSDRRSYRERDRYGDDRSARRDYRDRDDRYVERRENAPGIYIGR